MCLNYLLLLILLVSSTGLLSPAQGAGNSSTCRVQDFTCTNGECIRGYRECDNFTDCTDGSDEHALCGSSVCVNHSRCDNGRCIPRTWYCDTVNDCGDGSDEKTGCTKFCTDEQFRCISGRCILIDYVCDGEDDCGESEDEVNCTARRSCYDDEFKCSNSKCIVLTERCNQVNNCGDNSDEIDCNVNTSCNDTQFDCGNGYCIPQESRCDGAHDCYLTTGSPVDETDCNVNTSCNDTQFDCGNGYCIPQENRCDGVYDCLSLLDEANCDECHDSFHCNTGHCVPYSWLCNMIDDCGDNSDEFNCPFSCPDNHFICNDTHPRCIINDRQCDGTIDCRDGSDESDCWDTICHVGFGYIRCPYNGLCIPSEYRCDGANDCIDGSDEANCSITCSRSEFECRDGGSCVPLSNRCDGIFNCLDFSDEDDCSTAIVNCNSQQFDCGPGTAPRCISQAWVCDGQTDCENGLDEVSTNTSQCELQECNKETHFECLDNSKCIKIQFLCDGLQDCTDGSDEGLFCNATSCKNSGCSFGCSLKHSGPQCYCEPGYLLASDGISCEDIDECAAVNTCQQLCVNTEGSYECHCIEGYYADMKTGTCMAEGADPLLLVANRHDLITYDLRNSSEISTLRETHEPTSLAFHYKKSLIFYTDLDRQRIYKFDRSNSKLTPIISHDLASPTSIDVDWINDKIYWTDYGAGKIESSNLNGDNRVTVVSRDYMEFKPFYLAVDPHKKIMFWSNAGSSKAIEVSSMDGSDVRTIVDTNIGTVSGLTLDRIQQQLYWIDYGLKSIETCSYDGTNRFTLLHNDRMIQRPFSLAIFEDRLYWIDTKLFAVRSMQRYNGSHPITVVGTLRTPRSVSVYQEQMQPDGINYCTQHNCSHSSLLSSNTSALNCSCVCPDGLHLDQDGTNCVIDDHYQKSTHPACKLNKTFECSNKVCIHNSFVCDGEDNCGDGSDEIDNCTSAICEEGTFFCPGHKTLCASDSAICDGKVDCHDSRDEPITCRRTCKKDEFTCGNLLCINTSWTCDGVPDCWDGSDETDTLCANQTCQANEFRCTNHGCISERWVCDGMADCNDASDENNCDTIPCKTDEFTCGPNAVKYCIPQNFTCDGQDDCGDGSDESTQICLNSTVCLDDQFKCSNGACINQQFVCDGDDDCGDYSDEQVNCTLLPCEGASIRCNNTGACLPFWKGCDGVDNCGDGTDETNCQTGPPSCADNEFQCHTLHCIPMAAHCDGVIDCSDQSDETNCGSFPCLDGQFHCKISNLCKNATFVCDGDYDCPDHSDEERCDIEPKCPSSQFTCPSNNHCIDNGLVCDEKWDCVQGEDEINCGINECNIPNVHGCSHICEDHISSYKCACPAGMRLGSDEKNCEDIDECIEVFGACDQICTNVKGSYRCDCNPGFTLEPDGRTCKLNGEANLYVATGNFISRKSPDTVTLNNAILASSDNTIRTIAIHKSDLFYAPVHGYIKKHKNALHLSLAFNTDTENFIAVDSVLDMAVDWVGHKIYWTAADGVIYCADTEDPKATIVANASDGLGKLGEIAVHPKSSSMFIYNKRNHSSHAHIERWSLDGHFLQTVVSSKITDPTSIVVDSIIDRIYWSDSIYKHIHTARLDGTDRKSIVSGLNFTISSIAIFQNRIFFTISHQIFSKDRFKTDGIPYLTNHDSGHVHKLIFNSTAMQPSFINPCHNSSCAYACLPSHDATSSCACPPHSTLQEDEVTCSGVTSCPTKLCNVTGVCLPANALCNRYNDCPDGSDESNCDYCNGQFTCANEHCITHDKVCDFENNCGDNSDETIFACTCKHSFRCDQNTKCISMELVCDGNSDCEDNTDEIHCSYTLCNTTTHFRCDNGSCINQNQLCNGVDDCAGAEDETPAMCDFNCTLDQFKCQNNSRLCLNASLHCDGIPHCSDHSDEINCSSCQGDSVYCGNGTCLDGSRRCDGVEDCLNASDEVGCDTASCLQSQFQCTNGQCISLSLKCNGVTDCSDGSDETSDAAECLVVSNNGCDVENGGCAQLCNVTGGDNTVYCSCTEGYILSSDGRSCSDINECEADSYCSQLCENTVGSFQCSCFDGFTLAENRSCVALGENASLVGASGTDIVWLQMPSRSIKTVYTSDHLITSLKCDVKQKRLMWLEKGHDTIYSYEKHNSRTTSKSTLLAGLTSITTFTYDWISKSIIWCSKDERRVYVTSLDGAQYTLLQLPDSLVPTSIAVDPFRQYVYLTTTTNGSVIKTSLRSQNLHEYNVLVPSLKQPSQIVIDFYSGLLFFADVREHAIMSVKYDGSSLRTVLDSQHVYMPESLAVFEDNVFYCETDLQTVFWANKFGNSAPQLLQMITSNALTIFHSLLQPLHDPYDNTLLQPCKDAPCNKGLCLPVNDTSHRCICPEGHTINSTGACVEDVCSGIPCDPGLCIPNGTDTYYCTCPEGYKSSGSHCNAVQSQSTGHQSTTGVSIVILVVLVLVLIMTAAIGSLTLYRYYCKSRYFASRKTKLEDNDSKESASENGSTYRISPDSTTHQLINTQL